MKTEISAAAMTLVLTIALIGCATTERSLNEKGLQPLSEADLKSLYSRTRTAKWTNAQGRSGTGEYRTDGTASVNWGTGGAQGRYRIVGNTLCTQYPEVRGGVESCSRVYRTGENEYTTFFTDGDYNTVFSYTN